MWRVSSQSTTSAAASSARTRSVTSSRFPIGVAQTASGITRPDGVQRLEADEGRADQAGRRAELGLRQPHGAAHRLERLAPHDLLRRAAQVVVGGDAEAAAEDDQLAARRR